MIVDWLIAGIVLLSVVQPERSRLYAACLYSVPLLLHNWLCSDLTGLLYYGTAAAVDLFTITAITQLCQPTRLAVRVAKICTLSILANLFGWVIYMLYLPPWSYNAVFIAIYTAVILIMLDDTELERNDRTGAVGLWHYLFRRNNRSRLQAVVRH